MKKILSFSLLAAFIAFAFSACKKEETKAIMVADPGASSLSYTPNPVKCDSTIGTDTNTAVTLNWTTPTYGFDAAVNYTLLVAKDVASLGINKDSVGKVIALGAVKTKSWTNKQLSDLAKSYGITPFKEGTIYARITSQLANNTTKPILKSNVIEIKVTPYELATPVITYEYMWVPGDYQGWAPTDPKCQTLKSPQGGHIFKGIIEKTKDDGTLSGGGFKFTPKPNWDYDFGDNGSIYTDKTMGSGILGPKSAGTNGPDFKLADGTYYFEVDTTNLTWKYTLENWAVTGDATALGWPAGPGGTAGQDQNMRYNPATEMYELTINLTGGFSIKVRKNDDWTDNLGNATGADGDPVATDNTPVNCSGGGKNWGIVTSGSYTISLDPKAKIVKIKKN
jgi:starch-binding outer membrane protein SusE/F